MALFFDAEWFDRQLAARGLGRGDVARALDLNATQVAELWKDQRELSVADVRALATLLAVAPKEVASRAGVSTPIPADAPPDAAVAFSELNERMTRIERQLLELKAMLLDLARTRS